ncbi:MAG: hypothetical protein M1825_006150 [Sarcosagium campestre]|nr:MAG: hypothetical protein M1825_006150 [Sarcosagium campestre]
MDYFNRFKGLFTRDKDGQLETPGRTVVRSKFTQENAPKVEIAKDLGLGLQEVSDIVDSNSDHRPTMLKRRAEEADARDASKKVKVKVDDDDEQPQSQKKSEFRRNLFDDDVLAAYVNEYANSAPFKHGVIRNLLDPDLLRNVRKEVQENLSFSPKETDIYKIHQSGDLANLDGLDSESLSLLPSLRTLRDELYSSAFRTYLAKITGSGPLSGKKTDMAINVYTPGCHLLCHDDVIGSRRVSYILYLTDPDTPWQESWGGALRLYPTDTVKGGNGEDTKTPSPEFSVSIPPAFNQLSFFAVQPGESFHDVEEVYAPDEGSESESAGGASPKRVRMAISGWYHIPQLGEDGYVEGLEAELAKKSSLTQLEGNVDALDFPQPKPRAYEPKTENQLLLDDDDIKLLLDWIAPIYLLPSTLEEMAHDFTINSCMRIDEFLVPSCARKLKECIEAQEAHPLPNTLADIEAAGPWKVARPPHKHRYLYEQHEGPGQPAAAAAAAEGDSHLHRLLHGLLPSEAFRKWLSLATNLDLTSSNLLTRRFRRGLDYTLATTHEDPLPRLEITMDMTPTTGWEKEDDDNGDGDDNVGGYEVYMAGENDEDEDEDEDEDDSDRESEIESEQKMETTAEGSKGQAKKRQKEIKEGKDRKGKDREPDPTVYRAEKYGDGEGDNGVLYSVPPGFNCLSMVLRDPGVLRFVKYVSRSAKGDRWDIKGDYGLVEEHKRGELHGTPKLTKAPELPVSILED